MGRRDRSDRAPQALHEALVNRYIVEQCEADLALGFFFPGAEMVHTEPDLAAMPLRTLAPGRPR